jgi:cytochrome c556
MAGRKFSFGLLFFLDTKQTNIMKKTIIIAALAFTSVGFYQCTPSGDKAETKADDAREEVQRDIRKEKDDVTKELRDLRDNINNDLDKLSKKLETAAEKSRADVEEVRNNLTDQRVKVERALDAIESSSDTTWDDTQQNAKNTASEVKVEMERLSERVKAVFDNNNK